MAAKLAENAGAAAVAMMLLGCSDHHVSPWGTAGRPSLSLYVAPPDLDAKLVEIDTETKALGLRQTLELRGKLANGAGPVVVRGYEGTDTVGRRTTAVRAATQRGVVMAIGPLDPRDSARNQPTELVPALAGMSLSDLNGDGTPDALLRNELGTFGIWSLEPFGAHAYEVQMEVLPTLLLDADGDGRLDLGGRVPVVDGDPIAPTLDDVATFDGVRYDDATPAARTYHEQRAQLAATPKPESTAKPKPEAKEGTPPPDSPASRLRSAIERAWHGILAGRPKDRVLADLARERVDRALRSSFEVYRKRIEKLRTR